MSATEHHHTHTYYLLATTAGQEWVCACGHREPVNPPTDSTSATPTPEPRP